MNNKEMELYIEKVKQLTKELTSTKEKAQEYLIKTGIYNSNGELTENYGGTEND